MRISEYAELKDLRDTDWYIVDTDSGTYKVKGSTLKEFIAGGVDTGKVEELETSVKANTSSIAAFETTLNDLETSVKANTSSIAAFEMTLNDLETSVKANTSSIAAFEMKFNDGIVTGIKGENETEYRSGKIEITLYDILGFDMPKSIYQYDDILYWINRIFSNVDSSYNFPANPYSIADGRYCFTTVALSRSMFKGRKTFFGNGFINLLFDGYVYIGDNHNIRYTWTGRNTGHLLIQPITIFIKVYPNFDTGDIRYIEEMTVNNGAVDEDSSYEIKLGYKYHPDKYNPAVVDEILSIYYPVMDPNSYGTYIRIPETCTDATNCVNLYGYWRLSAEE